MTEAMSFPRPDFRPSLDRVLDLGQVDSWPPARHRFDERSVRAVRTAIAAERPLLVRGKPGIGKSQLARAVAQELNLPFLYHVVNARTEHTDLLYQYDAVSRLAQAQVLGRIEAGSYWKAELAEEKFVHPQLLWWAFDWADARKQAKHACRNERCREKGDDTCCESCGEPKHPEEGDGPGQWRPGKGCVVLIDEIDKADTDFQDDMLDILDQMQFDIIEIDRTVTARHRPVIIITSNAKKDLSDPFLGRCNFHHIAFPDPEMMRMILDVHFPNLSERLAKACLSAFYRLREFRGIEKKPATRELLNWVRALQADRDFDLRSLEKGDLPYLGVLFKKSVDLNLAIQQSGGAGR